MTTLILAILIAFSAGGRSEVCKLGEPLSTRVTDYDATRDSWEQWLEQNDERLLVRHNEFTDWQNPPDSEFTFWIYEAGKDSDYVVLFVWNNDNMPHGQCAKVFTR